MITGHVTATPELIIGVDVRGPTSSAAHLEAVLDTGFTGFLGLASSTIQTLGLQSRGIRTALLADGTTIFVDTYWATVLWNGQSRRVRVASLEGGPLIGLALLKGYFLTAEIRTGGALTIQRIP